MTVGLLLAVIYSVGLTMVGLDFGLLVGILTGLLSFIPYFGMFIGLLTASAISFFQFGDLVSILLVVVVFVLGQIIESVFLTPKLVGGAVGLHSVWVIFSLMAGGALFGFIGVLLAVPFAAIIGILMRFFLAQYLASAVYIGKVGNDTENTGEKS
jgi:predicted PurR-regulated permease PerM